MGGRRMHHTAAYSLPRVTCGEDSKRRWRTTKWADVTCDKCLGVAHGTSNAPPAQQSALERASQALKLMTVPPNLGKVDAVLLALVSEVREDCARIADNEAEVWAVANADMESSGRINDGAVAAMAIARRIRARNG